MDFHLVVGLTSSSSSPTLLYLAAALGCLKATPPGTVLN